MAITIAELKRTKAGLVTEMKSIATKETPDDGDQSRFDDLEKMVGDHDDRISNLEKVMELEAGSADPVDDPDKAFEPPVAKTEHRQYAQVAKPIEKGLQAARFLIGRTIALQAGVKAASDRIQKMFGDEVVAKSLLSVTANGAATIPTYFSTDIIELLRPMIAVRAAGAATIDTTGGNLTIPRLSAAATATWLGSTPNDGGIDIPTSNETFDTVILSNHKLVSMVTVSNDLLRRSPLGLDTIVRDDLVAVMARAEDIGFIYGASGGTSPTGLKFQAGIQSMFAAGNTLTNAVAAISGAVTKLQMANTRMLRPAWIMSPMTKNYLMSLRDGVGGFFVYEQELKGGTLMGYPVHTTSNVPINLTNYITGGITGTAGSDVFLADFADVLIGDTMAIQSDMTDVGAFWDGTQLQSTFSRDVTAFRIIKETDIVLRHPTSVVQVKVDSWTLF